MIHLKNCFGLKLGNQYCSCQLREGYGDIWDCLDLDDGFIVLPTNGDFRVADRRAVMGRGIAKQAASRFPDLPYELGRLLSEQGNKVYEFNELRLITFPVKRHWHDLADTRLIQASAESLREHWRNRFQHVYLPEVGCGNGGLAFATVKPILHTVFGGDDRFMVVHYQ